MMKNFRIIYLLTFLLFFNIQVIAEPLQANISKEGSFGVNKVIDANTKEPIKGAKIILPQKMYSTTTNSDGVFNLRADITGNTILSVEKEGYRPFSLTINEQSAYAPIIIGIEKTNPMKMVIDKDMFHLGDNNYSEMSANASQFCVKCIGPYYSKHVNIKDSGSNIFLVIGSIIGVDTKAAKSMGQNNIAFAYASPPEIYFNGNKIAEIQLNGDGQRFKIPRHLIKFNQQNEITIKTGHNLMQTAYIDYDDIEFMNIYIENN